MKFCPLLLAALLLAQFCFAQEAKQKTTKLSAGVLQFFWLMENGKADKNGALPNYVYHQSPDNLLLVNAIGKVSTDIDQKNLLDLGIKIGTKAGNIWTLKVPVMMLKDLTKLPGLLALDLDQPMAPDLDSARSKTRVDSIHRGIGLSQAYSGENVVVGIIDAGFDYGHPTFYDTSFSQYRVKRVWEQKTAGNPPSSFGYGAEFADSASILAKNFDVIETTHGTHVGGIAAGSGYGGQGGNRTKYRGMAFGSDLVLTAIYPDANYWLNTGMVDMLDGIKYTFQYAASVGKPAVANLSWGAVLGPRDGSSLFSQALDSLVGQGKIFVLSGGNNGQKKLHLKKTFTAVDTIVHTFLTMPDIIPKENRLEIWGDTGKPFCLKISIYNANSVRSSTEWICLDGQTRMFGLPGNTDSAFFTVTAQYSDLNNKPHILVQVLSRLSLSNRIALSVKSSSGTVHLWQGIVIKTVGYYGTFTKYLYPWAVDGDVQFTCGDLASTRKAIAVAAYNSKVAFTNISGISLSYDGYVNGRIAPFSSLGPTADGRIKPDIAGPGLALASGISSFDTSFQAGGSDYSSLVSKYILPQTGKTYAYGMLGGTSMAAPAVSGIVALLLQVNPMLKPEDILNLFKQTAIHDNQTGIIPENGNNVWGFGKVNAYRAIKKLLEPTGIQHLDENAHFLIFPNPTQGQFNMEYLGTGNDNLSIQIFDPVGRMMSASSWATKAGSNIKQLDTKGYAAGIYQIILRKGNQKSSVRIVVN